MQCSKTDPLVAFLRRDMQRLCGEHAADVLAFVLRTFDHPNVGGAARGGCCARASGVRGRPNEKRPSFFVRPTPIFLTV
jgi:hypothetical protein